MVSPAANSARHTGNVGHFALMVLAFAIFAPRRLPMIDVASSAADVRVPQGLQRLQVPDGRELRAPPSSRRPPQKAEEERRHSLPPPRHRSNRGDGLPKLPRPQSPPRRQPKPVSLRNSGIWRASPGRESLPGRTDPISGLRRRVGPTRRPQQKPRRRNCIA